MCFAMDTLTLSSDWTYRGLRVITLENALLRVLILPEAGAKILQIVYKPHDAHLLWNNPRIPVAKNPVNARYDDVWSGGWDELFPNDEATVIAGEPYPDHGELWTCSWDYTLLRTADEVGVRLTCRTPISAIRVEKEIRLCRGEAMLRFHHRFTNEGGTPFPFLWKLHPAFAVSPDHRIDFPAMRVVREPAFPGTLEGAPLEFDWPVAHTGAEAIDLRRVPPVSEQRVHFFYGTDLSAGWCALTNTATGLACGLRFDPRVFSSCWLFASYGGWRNYNVAVLEPCSGYPLNFDEMLRHQRARILGPGETLATEVLFAAAEGFTSVGNIDAQGTVMTAGAAAPAAVHP